MIEGEPRLIERDGQRQLVDATGATLVCRRQSTYAHGCFHRVDLDQFSRNGTITPRCEHVTGGSDDKWMLSRHESLDPTWESCQYKGCDGEETAATGSSGPQLATTLKNMSPQEFEAAVADHRSSNAEESV